MTRVALIGCGGMGNHHGPILARMPSVQVVATCDLVEEKARSLAEKTGVRRRDRHAGR